MQTFMDSWLNLWKTQGGQRPLLQDKGTSPENPIMVSEETTSTSTTVHKKLSLSLKKKKDIPEEATLYEEKEPVHQPVSTVLEKEPIPLVKKSLKKKHAISRKELKQLVEAYEQWNK